MRLRYLFVTLLALAVTAPAHAAGPSCAPGSRVVLGDARVAFAAVARHGTTTAFQAPARTAFVRFPRENANGYPLVFSVLGKLVDRSCRATWFHVELPMRPNGATGWVRARDVSLHYVTTRIIVDLSARRLSLYRTGHLLLETTVAVGASATPTPTGRYYVNQRLLPRDARGPYGPAAIGVSAFSNVLTNWAQGGPIGIHGTNEPWSIGHAASNGCIRVPNAVIRRLFGAVPAGTPVVIQP